MKLYRYNNFLNENNKPDYGYRSGSLNIKAENLYRMDSNRGTGHFGTGFYFFGTKEQAEEYDERNVTTVDFSKYNLLKVKNFDFGKKLHDALKSFNNGVIDLYLPFKVIDKISKSDIMKSLDKYKKDYSFVELGYIIDDEDLLNDTFASGGNNILKEKFIEKAEINIELATDIYNIYTELYSKKYKELYEEEKNKLLKNLRQAITINKVDSDKIVDIMYGRLDYAVTDKQLEDIWKIYIEMCEEKIDRYNNGRLLHEWKNEDSVSTRIMKYLGYEGIDVRGIKGLDNSEYGSVIYDIKSDSIVDI